MIMNHGHDKLITLQGIIVFAILLPQKVWGKYKQQGHDIVIKKIKQCFRIQLGGGWSQCTTLGYQKGVTNPSSVYYWGPTIIVLF